MEAEINTKTPEILVFEQHSFDSARGRLLDASGEIVHLRRQSAEVLAVLAARPGEIVSRDDLLDAVWPGVATTDDSLIQCIADIRRTLGKSAVDTFPKKGYLLRPSDTGSPAGRGTARWPLAAAIVAAILVLAVSLTALLTERDIAPEEAQVSPPPIRSDLTLAVLPFANLGEDPDLRFFSDGLSEDLTTDLAKLPGLTVISSLSSFDYRNAEHSFARIADDLQVRYLVRGTVRYAPGRVRINVSLIDAEGGLNIWSERYDRDRGDPFDIQENVAREIASALSLELGTETVTPPDVAPEAYYALLRGLEPLRRLTRDGAIAARDHFADALDIAPDYARAHALLAVSYGREVTLSPPGTIDPRQVETGLAAAVRAIQLDPEIPSAYFALAVLNLAVNRYDTALSAVRHALRLDPNYADAYALLAEIAIKGGDLGEGLEAIRRAKRLHPHHPVAYDWIEGHALFQLGRHDEAEPLLRKAVANAPQFLEGLVVLAANLGWQGRTGDGKVVLAEAQSLSPDLAPDIGAGLIPFDRQDRRDRIAEGLSKIADAE